MLTINSRRIGRFNISRPLMEDPQFEKMVLVIFSRIKVLRAQFNYQRELFEYEGICSEFEEMPIGSYIPEYELTFDAKSLKLTATKIVGPDVSTLEMTVSVLKNQVNEQQKALAELRSQLADMTLKLNSSLDVEPKLRVEAKPVTVRKPKAKKAAPDAQ